MILPVPTHLGKLWLEGELNDARLFLAAPDALPLFQPFYVWIYRVDGRSRVMRTFFTVRAFLGYSGFAGVIAETVAQETKRWRQRLEGTVYHGERTLFHRYAAEKFFNQRPPVVAPDARSKERETSGMAAMICDANGDSPQCGSLTAPTNLRNAAQPLRDPACVA